MKATTSSASPAARATSIPTKGVGARSGSIANAPIRDARSAPPSPEPQAAVSAHDVRAPGLVVEFYRHQLGDEEAASFRRVLDSLFLTLGPEVAAFEREMGAFLVRGRDGAEPPTVVGTSSCSMGLLVALRALGIGPGDEVITTPITFASTATAVLLAGATPVLVDVEPETALIDPECVRAAVGPRTRALLPVHIYGQLADMRALRRIADDNGLVIVEDSAHGVEMERDGVRPGDLGDAAVFSFYATKNITCGDGGAIVTRRRDLPERLHRLRNHGMSRAATERHGEPYRHWDIVELGYKANLTDLQAALLRPQLAWIESRLARREALARRYQTGLREAVPVLRGPTPSKHGVPWLIEPCGTSGRNLFTLHAPARRRDAILASLGAQGIGTAVNFRAIHRLSYFAATLGISPGALPVAEEIGDRTLSLPLYPSLTEDEQDLVVAAVARAFADAG